MNKGQAIGVGLGLKFSPKQKGIRNKRTNNVLTNAAAKGFAEYGISG
jgi:hypothetical protein